MSDIYVNRVYPDSNRLYSRPYMVGFRHLFAAQADKDYQELLESLHSMGASLIGDMGNYCCDLEGHPPSYFSTPFWNEERIVRLRCAMERLEDSISSEGRVALKRIVKQIMTSGSYNEANLGKNGPNISYNVPNLIADFKTLWNDNIFLDPRLLHAEEVFNYYADEIPTSVPHSYRNLEKFGGTLEWMAQPENAERIGQMFLYSRLAQHFGEVNPNMLAFSAQVANDINNGEANRLKSNPFGYYVDSTLNEKSEPRRAFEKVALHFRQVFSFASTQSRYESHERLIHAGGLRDTASTIVADYLRLNDGSWATDAHAELIQTMEVKEIRPGGKPEAVLQ